MKSIQNQTYVNQSDTFYNFILLFPENPETVLDFFSLVTKRLLPEEENSFTLIHILNMAACILNSTYTLRKKYESNYSLSSYW